MDDANSGTELDNVYISEGSILEKRKRDGKIRSKVWDHFSKIVLEDGSTDKCKCNHCHKLFSCKSKSGTAHLLRHITATCPAFRIGDNNGGMEVALYRPRDAGTSNDLLPSWGKIHRKSAGHSHLKGESWVNEFKSCVAKLVELADGKIPVGSFQAMPFSAPTDYSISAALRCLNEMDDIPQTSDMYLDAFEFLQDAAQRECFISLPPEPRRRWLQRVLHKHFPLRYSSNV